MLSSCLLQATDNLGAALDGLITLGQLAWTTNGSREASSHGGLSSPLLEGEQGAKQLQRSRSRLWRASSASSMHKLDPELGEASLLSSQQDPAAAEVQCEKVQATAAMYMMSPTAPSCMCCLLSGSSRMQLSFFPAHKCHPVLVSWIGSCPYPDLVPLAAVQTLHRFSA